MVVVELPEVNGGRSVEILIKRQVFLDGRGIHIEQPSPRLSKALAAVIYKKANHNKLPHKDSILEQTKAMAAVEDGEHRLKITKDVLLEYPEGGHPDVVPPLRIVGSFESRYNGW